MGEDKSLSKGDTIKITQNVLKKYKDAYQQVNTLYKNLKQDYTKVTKKFDDLSIIYDELKAMHMKNRTLYANLLEKYKVEKSSYEETLKNRVDNKVVKIIAWRGLQKGHAITALVVTLNNVTRECFLRPGFECLLSGEPFKEDGEIKLKDSMLTPSSLAAYGGTRLIERKRIALQGTERYLNQELASRIHLLRKEQITLMIENESLSSKVTELNEKADKSFVNSAIDATNVGERYSQFTAPYSAIAMICLCVTARYKLNNLCGLKALLQSGTTVTENLKAVSNEQQKSRNQSKSRMLCFTLRNIYLRRIGSTFTELMKLHVI